MPLVQPNQIGQPLMPAQPVVGGAAGQQYYTAEQVAKLMEPKKDVPGLIKTIVIVVVSLVALTFVGLFIRMYSQYSEARDDVDGQIAVAVAEAKDEQAAKMEAEFLEREKDPFKVFSGPADYGELTFEYPKTWSVYVAADAVKGGDFEAYFNPGQVNVVSDTTVNALRVKIVNMSFEVVAATYQSSLNEGTLSVESVVIGDGVSANYYSGKIPGTELIGYIVIFKIRDKTAILRTDSVLFKEDFEKILGTVTFNA